MEISGSSSLFSAGLSSYQAGQKQIDEAGQAIAASSLPKPDNSQVVAERQDTVDQLVKLKVGEVSAQTGTRILQTADEVLGTIIDTTA